MIKIRLSFYRLMKEQLIWIITSFGTLAQSYSSFYRFEWKTSKHPRRDCSQLLRWKKLPSQWLDKPALLSKLTNSWFRYYILWNLLSNCNKQLAQRNVTETEINKCFLFPSNTLCICPLWKNWNCKTLLHY